MVSGNWVMEAIEMQTFDRYFTRFLSEDNSYIQVPNFELPYGDFVIKFQLACRTIAGDENTIMYDDKVGLALQNQIVFQLVLTDT